MRHEWFLFSCSILALSLIPAAPRSCTAFVIPTKQQQTNNVAPKSPLADKDTTSIKLQKSSASVENWLASATLFLTALLSPVCFEWQQLPNHHHHLPSLQLSTAHAYLSEQQLLVDDVWKEVTRQYVDITFHGMGEDAWRQKRLEAVQKVANCGPDDTEQVYATIRTMLQSLGDPYTRFLTPEQYETLTATYARSNSDATAAASSGIGVQLLLDPRSGHVVVLNTAPDGPAAKAGIIPGDVIVDIDGIDMMSATAEVVAAKCRGETGTTVTLSIQHDTEDTTASASSVRMRQQQLTVTRAPIKSKSVESLVFQSSRGNKVGLLKVSSFNKQDTVSQVIQALKQVKEKGASTIVLDLRSNAGGYMPAGVEIAQLFLPREALIMTESTGRSTTAAIQYYRADGVGADTVDPIFVLVDERTASASEILTAALQDNGRAVVVGAASKTFGKGRIQNVQGPLSDGSGIAITKAKYLTPNGRDIQGVGIVPNYVKPECEAKASASSCLGGLV